MKTIICLLAPCRKPVRRLVCLDVTLFILHNSRVIYNSEEFQMSLWNCLSFLKEQCWCLCWKMTLGHKKVVLRLSLVCCPQLIHCYLWYVKDSHCSDPFVAISLWPARSHFSLTWTSDFYCFVSFLTAFVYACACSCHLVKFSLPVFFRTGYCIFHTLYFSKFILKRFLFSIS